MRSLFQAVAELKSRQRTDPATLAHHLMRSAEFLPQVVKAAVDASFGRPDSGLHVLRSTLTAASRTWAMLISGINRLQYVADGNEVSGQVIYAYVHMYSNLLHLMEEASSHGLQKGPAPQPQQKRRL